MFDENFSFLSSTSNTASLNLDDCSSSDVSPFTSRSSSPRGYRRKNSVSSSSTLPPTSRRDSRFDSVTSMPREHSVSALTAQFETQALATDESDITSSPTTITSYNSDFSDEGFVDGPPLADLGMPIDWDLPTSDPRSSYVGNLSLPSFALRRRQRQALVRLQCLAQRAPDLMMLAEEQHPSEIMGSDDLAWLAVARRPASSGSSSVSSGRVEKERSGGASVLRGPRMRKRSTR